MQNIKKTNIKRIAVIIGVIIIPLLYSYFYLSAFWDPYSSLDKMPVAIVNNDNGAEINGKNRNIGNEMCAELKKEKSFKFVFTNEADAVSGTENKSYYALVKIPKNFSKDIASADSMDKHTALITFTSNEKRNYLASQILNRAVLEIEEKVRGKVNKELVGQLSDKVKDVPNQLNELEKGLIKLYDGSNILSEGTDQLADATKTFNKKMSRYEKGISALDSGAAKLNSGTQDLSNGLDQLLSASDKLVTNTADIDKLSSGAAALAKNASLFNAKLQEYITGMDKLIASSQQLVNGAKQLQPTASKVYAACQNAIDPSEFLKKYPAADAAAQQQNASAYASKLLSGFVITVAGTDTSSLDYIQQNNINQTLKDTSSLLSTYINQISDKTQSMPELKTALINLKGGLQKAKSGINAIEDGTNTLSEGTAKAAVAASQLTDASNTLSGGTEKINSGAAELKDGISTAKNKVSNSVSDANKQVEKLEGLDSFAQEPVKTETQPINPVPNYGTAFAPYFLCLSLWVGGLIIFFGIFLDCDGKFKKLSRNSDQKVLRCFSYLLIGFVQALVLGVVLKLCLGLHVNNLPLYYLSCCLISMVFIAIIQLLIVFLKDIGKFLAIALLILQLTSCGGTFPMETIPTFFNILYPFMPMTYAVGLLKESISGPDFSSVIFNAGVLFAILVVTMVITVVCSLIYKKKNEALA